MYLKSVRYIKYYNAFIANTNDCATAAVLCALCARWIFISNLVIVQNKMGKRDCSWHGATGSRASGQLVGNGVGRCRRAAKAIFTTGRHANLILNTDKKTTGACRWTSGQIVFRDKRVNGKRTGNIYIYIEIKIIIITGSESLALILYARMSSALHVMCAYSIPLLTYQPKH